MMGDATMKAKCRMPNAERMPKPEGRMETVRPSAFDIRHSLGTRHSNFGIQSRQPRKGAVLIVVMIVVAVLALVGYQFADMAGSEHRSSVSAMRMAQARAAAASGVHYVLALLASPDNIK